MKKENQDHSSLKLSSILGNGFKFWLVILMTYIFIFGYIGYVAFWPMPFNDANNTIGSYFNFLSEYKNQVDAAESVVYFEKTMADFMKKSEDTASDLQQLASQSFNIVLGAFLAFLSATATTIFQSQK